MKTCLAVAVLFCFLDAQAGFAVVANPFPVKALQPDGTIILLQKQGDEFCHWDETPEGYAVVRNEKTGFWEYAELQEQGVVLRPSGIIYVPGEMPPPSLAPNPKPSAASGDAGCPAEKKPIPLGASPLEEKQPDGKRIVLFVVSGDDGHRVATPEGYSVVRNPRTGFWEYASQVTISTFMPSGVVYRPSIPAPKDLRPHQKPTCERF